LLEAGALMLSFIGMRLLKFAITGSLPDTKTSMEVNEHYRTPLQIILMFIVTCAWFALIVCVNCYLGSDDVEDQKGVIQRLGIRWLRLRTWQLLGKFACFFAALALLTTVQWTIEALLQNVAPTGRRYLVETAEALVATAVAYTVILCIGRVDEVLANARSFAGLEATEDILATIGCMAGFAWEHVFHEAIEAISEYGAEQFEQKNNGSWAALSDIVLAFTIIAFVLPTLYWYINPQARRSQGLAKQNFKKLFEEAQEEEEDDDDEDDEETS